MKFGYQLSYSFNSPLDVVDQAEVAEDAAFDFAWNEDHFHPYVLKDAECGNPWVVMGVIAERTERMKVGPLVTTTLGGRYHPATLAQASATLDFMYPGRIILGLGSGEGLQTVPLNAKFPKYSERQRNLLETIEIIRKLWGEDRVDYDGKYYGVRGATLYTKPKEDIPLMVAARGPKSAKLAGMYADMIDLSLARAPNPDEDTIKSEILPAIEEGAEEVGKHLDDIVLQGAVEVSIDEDYEKAFESAKEPVIGHYGIYEYESGRFFDPKQVRKELEDALSEQVDDPDSELYEDVCITTETEDIIREVEKIKDLGMDSVFFLNFSPDKIRAIRVIGDEVIPHFK